MRLNARWLLVAVAGIVPAFIAGYLVAQAFSVEQAVDVAPEPVLTEPVDSEATAVFPNLELGPRPVGEWKWRDLRGGECIDSFEDLFAETFQVVSCSGEYAAVLTRVQVMAEGADAPYPGDDVIRERAAGHCENWDLGELNRADRYDDLLAVPSYSLGEGPWKQGDRLMGCFIFRDSGKALTGELLG